MELISSSPKFDVFRSDDVAVKVAKTEVASRDLARAVDWSEDIGSRILGSSTILIPGTRTIEADDVGCWIAEFDWLEGRSLADGVSREDAGLVASGLVELSELDVDWEASAADWCRGRFSNSEISCSMGALGVRSGLSGFVDLIEPGVAQGDFGPQNLLVIEETEEGRKLSILDPELGTHGNRLNYAMPRMHDAAYFYHFLLCGLHDEEAADNFYHEIMLAGLIVNDKDYVEFWLSALERTVSMHRNLILFPKEGFKVDPRRKVVKPYASLVEEAQDRLFAFDPSDLTVVE